MQVVGVTTEQVITIASKQRKFQVNEILVIEDEDLGFPKGEVVETRSFNRFIPEVSYSQSMVDEQALEALRRVGWNTDEETVHVARLRILDELVMPIRVGARVRLPSFAEVKGLLVKRQPGEGLVLGVIRGTAEIAARGMDEPLREVALLYDKETGILPQNGIPFVFDHKAMDQYPHIGVFGGSGSGKSFGLRVILEELMQKRFPCIVFDPHFEMDFSRPFDGLPESYARDFSGRFLVLTIGQDAGIKFETLDAEDLTSLLEGVGHVTEPQRNAVATLHKSGDSFHGFFARVRNLLTAMEDGKELERLRRKRDEGSIEYYELEKLRQFEQLLEQYGTKIGHSSPLRSLSWKLNRLEQEGVFNKDIQPVVDGLLERKLVVIRGSLWLLKVISAFAVRQCYMKRREYRDAKQKGEAKEKFPPFAIVTDEAHHFAPKDLPAPSKGILKEIAQEGRKYGVFLIFATQRPALLDETITAQLNTKMVFRTVRSHDIEVLKQETDISREEAARLPYLASGTAFVSSAIIGRSMAIKIRAAKTASPHAENPFDEIETMYEGEIGRLSDILFPLLPLGVFNLASHLEEIRNAYGRPIGQERIIAWLDEQAALGRLRVEKTPFGNQYSII